MCEKCFLRPIRDCAVQFALTTQNVPWKHNSSNTRKKTFYDALCPLSLAKASEYVQPGAEQERFLIARAKLSTWQHFESYGNISLTLVPSAEVYGMKTYDWPGSKTAPPQWNPPTPTVPEIPARQNNSTLAFLGTNLQIKFFFFYFWLRKSPGKPYPSNFMSKSSCSWWH